MSEAQKMVALVLATRDALDRTVFAQAVREYYDGLLLAEEQPLRPLTQMGKQEQQLLFLRRFGVKGADTQCTNAYASEAWALQLQLEA